MIGTDLVAQVIRISITLIQIAPASHAKQVTLMLGIVSQGLQHALTGIVFSLHVMRNTQCYIQLIQAFVGFTDGSIGVKVKSGMLKTEKPSLSDEDRQYLTELYDDEIRKTEKLTGLDLSAWR